MPLKNASDYPSSAKHQVCCTENRKLNLKKAKTLTVSLSPINQSFQENHQALSCCIIITFLPWFLEQNLHMWHQCIIVISRVVLKQSRGCDWTLRFAPELYFEKKTTEPQIMLYSPLFSCTVIRFSLCWILEKDCHSGFLQSKWQALKSNRRHASQSMSIQETYEMCTQKKVYLTCHERVRGEGWKGHILTSGQTNTVDNVLTVIKSHPGGVYGQKTKASQCQAHNKNETTSVDWSKTREGTRHKFKHRGASSLSTFHWSKDFSGDRRRHLPFILHHRQT